MSKTPAYSSQVETEADNHRTKISENAEILWETATIDSSKWTLGLAASFSNPSVDKQISELAATSFPPNLFFDTPILSAAIHRIGALDKKLLYLSETIGGEEILRFLAPVQITKLAFTGMRIMRIWNHLYAPNSIPLMEHANTETIIQRLAQGLSEMENPPASAVYFEGLHLEADFTKSITAAKLLSGKVTTFSMHERAALNAPDGDSYEKKFLSGKRKQRLRTAMRRLENLGNVSFETVTDFNKVMLRFEEFLLLETQSWKGRKGTSMHRIKTTAAFARQSVVNMVAENRCAIHSLRLDGKAVSSMIMFEANGYYFPWKIAFNEDYSSFSVGNQLVVHINSELYNTPGFKGIDSLAASFNSTANRFWAERIKMCDMAIGLGENAERNASYVQRYFSYRSKLKTIAKKILLRK